MYEIEREGQIDFFNNYGIPYNDDNSILIDNTDGIYNGCILEFKLNIDNLNKVLFQAIKYLSKMRIKGESVPAIILLIDLNAQIAYKYKSIDYKNDIHKVYVGASSKDNAGFTGKQPDAVFNYSKSNADYMKASSDVKKILKAEKSVEEQFMPIDIDENCIVGWAERYYSELPNATKGDFLGDENGVSVSVTGEIRKPRHFKGLINAYTGRSNEKFKYLMDCLNDRLQKKDLGAYYTPMEYARKAAELVEMAVAKALGDGKNDYIILDRCGGTGNLECALIGLKDKNGSELISHCIVSTYEYYEYKVLNERVGDVVREIIPPSKADVVYESGKVSNADAMGREYIDNPIIKRYLDDRSCAVILFENPPYGDSTAITFRDKNGKGAKSSKTGTFVHTEFKKISNTLNEGTSSARDFTNLFVWSGFEYYMRDKTDAFIVFSPVKYFKSVGLGEKKFVKGFLFNRKYFHAGESAISCVYWQNVDEKDRIEYPFEAVGIDNGIIRKDANCVVKKCFRTFNDLYDGLQADDVKNDLWCAADGTPMGRCAKVDVDAYYNENIIAAMCAVGYSLDANNRGLIRQMYFHHGKYFYIRKDTYLKKLPLWVAKMYPIEKWYEKDVVFNSSDKGDSYACDKDLLKSCLIYACLSNQNKCLSFDGQDGRLYLNELCFDGKSVASGDISKMELDVEEQSLLSLWSTILEEAKRTKNYKEKWTYGVYQIEKELNTFQKIGSGKTQKTIYDYPKMNGDLETLRVNLKSYYKTHITQKMFEYELLK